MTAPLPIGLIGNSITRVFTLAVPSSRVRMLLPQGLELGEQEVTPDGTHPVMFLFQNFFQCQFSVPLPFPSMSFLEHTVCVPYTNVRRGYGPPGGTGPYCFMPKLYLTDPLVMLGGIFVWGYDKEMAAIEVSNERYSVRRQNGPRIASLEWRSDQNSLTLVKKSEAFEPVRRMLHQKLVSALPIAVGPWLALTDFERRWNLATVRPVRATMELTPAHLPAFEAGHYSSEAGEASVPGAFELHSPWYLSLPYYTMYPLETLFPRAAAVV